MDSKVGHYDDLYAQLQRVTRNEMIVRNFAKALWQVLKQYKQKLLVILVSYVALFLLASSFALKFIWLNFLS